MATEALRCKECATTYPLAVNVPPQEADLRLLPAESVRKALGDIDIQLDNELNAITSFDAKRIAGAVALVLRDGAPRSVYAGTMVLCMAAAIPLIVRTVPRGREGGRRGDGEGAAVGGRPRAHLVGLTHARAHGPTACSRPR